MLSLLQSSLARPTRPTSATHPLGPLALPTLTPPNTKQKFFF